MIIFNTIKSAQHYVKHCNKRVDHNYEDGYIFDTRTTYIEGKYVKYSSYGDSCGCGCDLYRYSSITIIGKIKKWDLVSNRDIKIKNILGND